MITFKGDERFADVEFAGIHHDPLRGELVLEVSSDPADNCGTIFLRNVAAFDVLHFSLQNVVQFLDVARVVRADLPEFLDLAGKEEAFLELSGDQMSGAVLLGAVFVPANGAAIYALCRAVEKCGTDGRPLYSVEA